MLFINKLLGNDQRSSLPPVNMATIDVAELADLKGKVAAISKSQGVIEFDLNGHVLDANDNFLRVVGYELNEIIGKHHSLFVDLEYRQSYEYRQFWDKLGRGEFDAGQYKRIGRSGKEIWIQGSYNPIFDQNGKPFKVVKYAADISAEKMLSADHNGQLAAISKSQGVIEFNLDGTVITANDNFLAALGYSLSEIKGQHHSMFVDPVYRQSVEYRSFWEKLGRGEYDAGQYKRIGKGGKEIWIQASYNPILDMNGHPFKVVKYASDVTESKLATADFQGQLAAISKSQAVIEFNLDGTIINANENFLAVLGYSLSEIKGKHHSLFVDTVDRQSHDYRIFWEKLARGEYDAGQYKRIDKTGKEIWIQASYNPIMDLNGKPFKVVKYASDITKQVNDSIALQKAVEQTQAVVSAAVNGDLRQHIPLEGKTGMLEVLCSGVNDLVDSMADIVLQIQQASQEILMGTSEISKGNSNLSSRTEQQAASLEETASSMEELTSTVKQNAENARQANQLAIGASDIALKGGEVVNKVVLTMSEINDSAKKIVDIISVIDGIAFQTNILALNAAVEAARAGEQGRGFAVVASEVRNLAQRSAGAAKEIKTLIGDSVVKVEAGSKLVDQAGHTMQDVVGAVRRVTDIMSEISAASSEQSAGIEQVNQAVTQMDENTQQNAALVEEAAAAAESLEEQARNLNQTVGIFKLATDPPVRAVSARATPTRQAPVVARVTAKPVLKSASRSVPQLASSDGDWEEF
ncbi:methyl-accepting chemotaxis protein [Deefgea rivuli]|uniref:methyl-accepting chemotaxis protein n=1 Tax=Deefgea rivuli TaxID=400948 RepID=UPI000685DB64|nr:methyl-accepting chemotaxis protein [Deefgea rivuli]